MRNRRSTEITAVLIASTAAVAIFFVTCESSPRIDGRLHAAIGKALGKEALGLLRASGQITIITRDNKTFPQPALDLLLASFKREVGRAGGTIAAIKSIQADPLRPLAVPPGDFFELIQRLPAEHVIVSLLGPPLLAEEQFKKLKPVKPKIVAFCPGNLAEHIDLRQLFEAGLLHAAVASRPASAVAADNPATVQDAFEQLYRIVKAEEFSSSPQGKGRERGEPTP
jgi:hypothetical protein